VLILPFICLLLAFILFAIFCCWRVNKVGLDSKVTKILSHHAILGFFYIGILGSSMSILLVISGFFVSFSLSLPELHELRELHESEMLLPLVLVILPILIVIFSDTFAYFGGKKFGKSLCAPNISPKKTWAGFWFGLLGATLPIAVALLLMTRGDDLILIPLYSVILGVLLGILAHFGDLFESLIKRINGVKDSGNLLPGHGGVLDRVDGLLFVLPSFWLSVLFTVLLMFFSSFTPEGSVYQ
jgi:phosphatidate cytidylyltransferase